MPKDNKGKNPPEHTAKKQSYKLWAKSKNFANRKQKKICNNRIYKNQNVNVNNHIYMIKFSYLRFLSQKGGRKNIFLFTNQSVVLYNEFVEIYGKDLSVLLKREEK